MTEKIEFFFYEIIWPYILIKKKSFYCKVTFYS